VLAPLGTDPAAIARQLEGQISPADATSWTAGTASSWAEESYAAAKASAYTIHPPSGCESDRAPIPLSAAYQAQALATAQRQLEKAGVRLAWMLNDAAAKVNGHP
jgi:hypothetical protein